MGPTWAKVFVWRMESKIKESIPIPISGRVNNFNGQFRYHKIPFFVTCVSVCFSNTEFIARNICNFRRSANRAIVIWLQFNLNIENKKKTVVGENIRFSKNKNGIAFDVQLPHTRHDTELKTNGEKLIRSELKNIHNEKKSVGRHSSMTIYRMQNFSLVNSLINNNYCLMIAGLLFPLSNDTQR